ncbi:MAG: PD40 domain-containing protein [Flavobacteriaceae bacterium]|nr:PD40 domain-containing protein [Flavobacteriaceae bacterium]
MKTKQIFLPLLFLLTTSITFAQGSGSSQGDKHFNKLAYAEAIEVYLNDVNKASTSPILYRNLADSYYKNAMLTKAVKWYKKYTETTEGKIKPEHMFRYAQALKAYKNYKASDQWMNKFYREVPEDSRGQYYVDNKSYLLKIEFNSGRHTIKNVNFNTSAPEFAPAYLGENEILFSSVRDTSGVRSFDHMWTKSGFTDIFSTPISEDEFVNEKQKALGVESDSITFKEYSKVTKKDSLVIKHYSKVAKSNLSVKSEVKKIGKKVNSKYNESTAIVSKDGTTMYFTRNNYTNKKYRTDDEGVNRLKLYTSKLVDGVWGNIEELPFNSNDYSVAHPALNVDEKRLYFASDMPGSLGMSDIFYVNVLGENSYGEPINLGEKVNTEGRETYPFISDKGRLYIASDGHVGLGGLDVFEVKQNIQGDITKIRNVGEPITAQWMILRIS